MAVNTHLSDINEIHVGYRLNGNKWYDEEARQVYNAKLKQTDPADAAASIGKANVMAEAFVKWAKDHGYRGNIKNVWWTARMGSMSKAVGVPVDQKKNPTDILVKFDSGPSDGFLGLSAKATNKVSGDIGFKNPGIGTLDKSLNITLAEFYKKKEEAAIKKFGLPPKADLRKVYIRANPGVKVQTEAIANKTMMEMRDMLLARLQKFKNKELLSYLLNNWMDADLLYPPYVKVTGQGNKEPYTAVVMDPTDNPKLEAMRKYPIKLEPFGNETIGVSAGGKKIMKMRFKFESEKMASSIKMSGDPW